MQSKARTVRQYLAELPDERREAISAVRKVILEHLPEGYAEGMSYGMIGYHVPHRVYPPGYHCNPDQPLPFAALASQKNHMAIYLMCIYGDAAHEAWFRKAWTASGKKLDMGKSCVRFKKLADVPLDVVGRAVARVPVEAYIAHYEATIGRGAAGSRPPARRKTAAKANAASAGATSSRAGAAVAAANRKKAAAAKKKPAARKRSARAAAGSAPRRASPK